MIKKIRIINDIAIITGQEDFHPLRQLKSIEKELEKLHFIGTVLFDLLSFNGVNENRFVSIFFEKNRFDRSSFQVESNINKKIEEDQNEIIRKDKDFLLCSILSSHEIDNFIH